MLVPHAEVAVWMSEATSEPWTAARGYVPAYGRWVFVVHSGC